MIPLLRVHYYFPMDSTKPSPSGRRARKREGTDRKHTSIHLAFILVPYSYLFLFKPFFNAASVTVDGFEMECQCPTNECRQFPEKSIFFGGKCITNVRQIRREVFLAAFVVWRWLGCWLNWCLLMRFVSCGHFSPTWWHDEWMDCSWCVSFSNSNVCESVKYVERWNILWQNATNLIYLVEWHIIQCGLLWVNILGPHTRVGSTF